MLFVHGAKQRECRNSREARGTIASRLRHNVLHRALSRVAFVCAYVLRLAPIDTATNDDGDGTVGKNASNAFHELVTSRLSTCESFSHRVTICSLLYECPIQPLISIKRAKRFNHTSKKRKNFSDHSLFFSCTFFLSFFFVTKTM